MIAEILELGQENDKRLLRLRTALALGRGFQLVIIEAEPGPIRREVIRRIKTWSGYESIGAFATVTLDPAATLPVQLEQQSGAIVTGFEPPSPTESPARDWVGELNWSRDLLPELVPGPFILVVSQAIHRELFERAPDLFSWRRHTTHVTVIARELALPLSSPGDPYWLEASKRLQSILAQVVVSPSGRTTLLLNLAGVLLHLGDEPAASRMLEEVRAPANTPTDIEDEDLVQLGRAECALLRGDLAIARKLLEAVTRTRVDALQGGLALLRGKLYAVEGAWDEAVVELMSAIMFFAHFAATGLVRARARECLAQVAFARGEIARGRSEIAELVEAARPSANEWGIGMMLRLATAIGDVYPDEIAPLLDAVLAAAASLARREAVIAVRLARARRAWLLSRAAVVREELAHARGLIRSDDSDETHGLVHLYEAAAALVDGGSSEDEGALHLSRAGELLRTTAPKQAAIAEMMLGELRMGHGHHEPAIAAYRAAVEDARAVADHELAAAAELATLGSVVNAEIDDAAMPDRLCELAERFQANGHMLREGIARAHAGRALLRRRGRRESATAELEHARACFEATTDAAREREVARLLEAAP